MTTSSANLGDFSPPIAGLAIDGFRTLTEVELLISGPVTVVCGPNNTGKSSLLTALDAYGGLLRQLSESRRGSLAPVLDGFVNGSLGLPIDFASPAFGVASGLDDPGRFGEEITSALGTSVLWLRFKVEKGVPKFDPNCLNAFWNDVIKAWSNKPAGRGGPPFNTWGRWLAGIGGRTVSVVGQPEERLAWAKAAAVKFLAAPEIRRISDVRRTAEEPLSASDLRQLTIASQRDTNNRMKMDWARTLEKVLQDVFGKDVRYTANITESDDELLLAIDGEEDLPIDQVGAGVREVVAIAFRALSSGGTDVLVIEEPENCLHPGAVRKLVRSLADLGLQLFVSTHSASVVNSQPDTVIEMSRTGTKTSAFVISDAGAKFRAIRALGHSASDLVMSPCAVWVEGPSDKNYLSAWLENEGLLEGIDFHIAFFAGALATHLTTSHEPDAAKLLSQVRPLTRRCIFVVDSDRSDNVRQSLKPHVRRWRREVQDDQDAEVLVTWGREIENSIDVSILNAIRASKRLTPISEPDLRFARVTDGITWPKVRLAQEVIQLSRATPPNAQDLVRDLSKFIRASASD